jgi:hypothetical protein
MERNDGSRNTNQSVLDKPPPSPQCENPRQNGTKPAIPPRTSEQSKKHIRKDGKR